MIAVTAQTIGQQIRSAREAAGWKPEKLAALIDVSLYTLQRWETGKTDPSYRQVAKIADLLERPIEWFVGEEEKVA